MEPNVNSNNLEIQPVSTTIYQVEEKCYVLEPNTYDIGKYLNLLKIKPFQKINITLKEGNYSWDENYITPEDCTISLNGENYKNGGRDNKVTILINKKNTKIYEGKEYAVKSRLQILFHSYFSLTGIDIIEKINDSRDNYGSSDGIGVFNLCGRNGSEPVFCLKFGCFEVSSSPFINIQGNNIKGRIIFNYSYFNRNTFSNIHEIVIVDTNSGWNGKGSMAEVSLTLTNLSQGCKFLTNNKSIIYSECRSPSDYFNYY